MIDYSVYMQHNPMDDTAAPKAYAKAQMRELMSFADFVGHIAQHNGVFSRGTVKGVVSDTCSCIVEQLLEGKKIQFGELGTFWISLSCESADSMDDFSATNIKAVNIVFTPGEDFENLRSKANFNLVASRVAQAATLKTEKAGGAIVDLAAAKAAARANANGDSTSGSDTNSGSGSTTPSGGGENTGGSTPTGGDTNTGGGSNTGGEGGGDNGGDENGDAN